MQIKPFSYTGNGGSLVVNTVGFLPKLVITKARSGSHNGAITMTSMGVDVTKDIVSQTASFSGGFVSLDSGGFTLGASLLVNAAGVVYDCLAIGGGTADVKTGSYLGNGTAGHAITGVGFAADLVIAVNISGSAAIRPQWTMDFVNTVPFGGASGITNGFTAVGADGFTLGINSGVNENGETYYYVALKKVAGFFNTLTYNGNGADNRSITGAAFAPDLAWTKSNFFLAPTVFRGKDQVGDSSTPLDGNASTDRIQAREADGIQVGTNSEVNDANATAYYVAVFKSGSSSANVFPYTPTGGITMGGHAPFLPNHRSKTGVGGIVTGGNATTRLIHPSNFAYLATGGIVTGGAAVTKKRIPAVYLPTGLDGIVTGGVASTRFRYGSYPMSGGIVTGGEVLYRLIAKPQPYIEDSIQLSNTVFPIKGLAQGDSASEWETGLKTGPQSYDTRTNAFFEVMDDFSGGMGHRRFDSRSKERNTFWDYPTDIPAADTRRAGHLTLGPAQSTTVPADQPTVKPVIGNLAPSYPFWGVSGRWQFAVGGTIYETTDGINFHVKLNLNYGQCNAIVLYSAYRSYFTLYAMFSNGNYYRSDDGGFNWVSGGPNVHVLNDGLFWDSKVLAAEGNTIIFGIRSPFTPANQQAGFEQLVSSTRTDETFTYGLIQDGLPQGPVIRDDKETVSTAYKNGVAIDKTRTTEDEAFDFGLIQNGLAEGPVIHQSSIINVYETTLTPADIAAIGALQDVWNIDQPADKQPMGVVPLSPIRFVGIATAPWGEPAAYFIAAGVGGSDLYVLDFYARKVYPIRVGLELQLTDGRMWQHNAMITDGWNVYAYDAGRGSVQNVGLPTVDGVPPSLEDPALKIANLIPADQYLYAALRNSDTTGAVPQAQYRTRVMCFNGKGWHQIGEAVHNILPIYGAMAAYELASPPTRRLHVFGTNQDTKLTVMTWDTPTHSNVPSYGQDHFAQKGGLITGWMDGGFSDISGALLKMSIDALNLSTTETVRVEYQLDNDEDEAWRAMYDVNGNQAVFNDEHRALYFAQTSPTRGTRWRTVRFKFTLSRGADDTKTPEVKAFILTYLKKPEFRSQWTFTIDINRMLEVPETYTVDGETATVARIWRKLRQLWNTQTLLPITIPSVEVIDLDVIITGTPISFDDFRSSVKGKGQLVLKVLEPVARVSDA